MPNSRKRLRGKQSLVSNGLSLVLQPAAQPLRKKRRLHANTDLQVKAVRWAEHGRVFVKVFIDKGAGTKIVTASFSPKRLKEPFEKVLEIAQKVSKETTITMKGSEIEAVREKVKAPILDDLRDLD